MKHDHHVPDEHDLGLAYDLATMLSPMSSPMLDRRRAFGLSTVFDRRRTLQLLAGVGMIALVGCGSDDDDEGASGGTSTTGGTGAQTTQGGPATTASTAPATTVAAATGGSCTQIPTETAGPFPGDGSNGPNVLNQSGVVRSDITTSFGSMSGTAKGVPLTINLTIVDDSKSCAGYANAAVYLWHCDIDGGYSLYSQGVTNQNYLRGVQQADSRGVVSFKSIFPAAYSGRWPHIHFEIFPTLAAAGAVGGRIATSQLALPEDVCNTVYATTGYSASVRNMTQTSLARDNVFSDGSSQQVATVTGSVGSGLVAALRVPV